MKINPQLTHEIIGAAMEVHSYWGPGLIESIYEESLAHELTLRGIPVERQVLLDLKYKELEFEDEFRLDLVVGNEVVVELKVVKALIAIHRAQLLTYLRLTNYPVGLLINFNVVMLRDGIERIAF